MDLRNLTIVVCTKNAEIFIEKCLQCIKKESPESELLIVDADSTDKTVEIAKKYADRIVSDQRKGLAYARQLGIDLAKNNLVLLAGPDNQIPRPTIVAMIQEAQKDEQIAGVQAVTSVIDAKNYWEWATKHIFALLLNTTGDVDVVGTPCIFKKNILTKVRYDEEMEFASDDTAVCLKLINAGFTLRRISAEAYEKQNMNFKNFCGRWIFYGRGDESFYRMYSKDWSFKRKFRSLFHPFMKYSVRGSLMAVKKGKFHLIPALLIATWARYYGWIAKAIIKISGDV